MIFVQQQPTPREEMRAYDQLPKEIREALSRAGDQFSAVFILRALLLGQATRGEIVQMIREQDRTR